MEYFTTLMFKNKKDREDFGPYAIIYGSEWAGGCVPNIMTSRATLKDIHELNPKLDMDKVKLVTIRIDRVGEVDIN